MDKKKNSIYLIDGNSLCYRGYYAIRELSTSKGMPTNAIYGFINMLRKIIRDYSPSMMAVVFDTPAPTVRHKKYEDYKIHRKPMPDDLICQMPRIKEVIAAYNIPACELDGYEADDIIATLAEKASKKNLDVTIVTGDKDALQLVDDKIRVLSPSPGGDKIYSAREVRNKYSVSPELIVELMALTGDASDNIPGVKGVGLVTAGKLINQYGSLEGIYKDIESVTPESLRKKLAEGKEAAMFSRELILLNRDVSVKLDFDRARLGEPSIDRLSELYREFEFEKLLREITPEKEASGKYFIESDKKKLRKEIETIRKNKTFSFCVDADPDNKNINGVALSCKAGEAYYVPFGGAGQKAEGMAASIRELIEDGEIKKIGYDLKREMTILRSAGIVLEGTGFDVMVADYLIEPSRSKYDLSGIAMRRLSLKLSDRKDGSGGAGGQSVMGFSDPVAARHKCEQSDIILRLYKVLEPVLVEKKLMALFMDVEMPLVRVLTDIEAEGVGINVTYLEELSAKMKSELDEVIKKIYRLAGEEFNINSPKQLQGILFDKLKLPSSKRTKSGPSTDESVLRKLLDWHELPAALLEYRAMNKLKTSYYDSILDLVDNKTEKLHTSFNQTATATGRLSSSGPNLQNIPIKTAMGREIRRVFIPEEKEELLLTADYSQIELRILAHLSGDQKLIEAFENGEDIHRFTASLIFDCALDKVTGDMRSVAKTVNFGIAYGMSPFGLAKDLDISIDKAASFIDAYFERYSGVKVFIEDITNKTRKNGFVTTLFNRRRYIPGIISKNEHIRKFAERAAVNTPVQGTAADIIKLAMIACDREFKDTGVKMIIQVHDELVFKVPKGILEAAAKKVRESMEGVIKLKVPLKVDIKAGKNWLDMEAIADSGK